MPKDWNTVERLAQRKASISGPESCRSRQQFKFVSQTPETGSKGTSEAMDLAHFLNLGSDVGVETDDALGFPRALILAGNREH